ncbi:hypothetical protein H113_05822 [Trichophyton rubrum MR1459]|nr:hypothetical protein H100_05785 [Trichophyton rubrum MR850]EZF40461.1 hypothetical protein H102_05753 [Trichophyton rubrum CBS 100081]EZF93654.1 hypothetical protein H113_05822 [Trichophyton rubrum MR1459]EZG04734.1 hypothetical protein H106_05617 [Trichophyton rubrum CBS 735.88]
MQLATDVCNKLARIARKRRTDRVVDMKQHAKGLDEMGGGRGKGVQPAGERIAIYLRITGLREQGDSVRPCVVDAVARVNAGQMYGSTGQGMPACGHPRPGAKSGSPTSRNDQGFLAPIQGLLLGIVRSKRLRLNLLPIIQITKHRRIMERISWFRTSSGISRPSDPHCTAQECGDT